MNLTNKDKTVALLNSIESGDQTAASYINPHKYTQHNLSVGDGLAGFGALLQKLPKNSARVNVVRSFQDGDFVFTHTDYNFFGPKVGFDVFRFENDLIVEHWDNLSEKPEKPNPSGHTQIDGPAEIKERENTQENKGLIRDFIETILMKGAMNKLAQYFDGDNYVQHNTKIGDGLSGLGLALGEMAKQGISMVYTKIHKVLGEGNFVLCISEGSFADKPTSFYDLFRVESGKIVEHWDVMETILPKDQWQNSNGKFGNL
jgi:predicted SnoaL-like aldol condensation-catalyzing enzyme